MTTHLKTLGVALVEPMSRLIESASQTPKAAADVIQTLRGEMSKNLERDNDLLTERTSLMAQLNALATTLEQTTVSQQNAINSFIEGSTKSLSNVEQQFAERLLGESEKMASMVEHFSTSSSEIASLGDAFNGAVMLFSDSNGQLIESLNSIQASLQQSSNRSDEQLAYYVAQAREIIDHNLLSHKEIIDSINAHQPAQAVITKVVSS